MNQGGFSDGTQMHVIQGHAKMRPRNGYQNMTLKLILLMKMNRNAA